MRAAPWLRLRPPPAARWTSAHAAEPTAKVSLTERLTPTALARAAQAVLGAPGGPWLNTLLSRVQTGRYRPGPVRHRSRPKADGTTRTLSIPHPVDRVLQRAVLDLVGPDLDRLLLPAVHGFRPGRSPQTAVRALLATPPAPHLELVQADIASMFDRLPHDLVRRTAHRAYPDPLWRSLVDLWLAAWSPEPGRGVPQGAPLSPLLANLALDDALDRPLQAALGHSTWGLRRWVRYGDDITLVCTTPGATPSALAWLEDHLRPLGMGCKAAKTSARSGPLGEASPVVVLGIGVKITRHGDRWRLERADSARH